MAQGLMLEAADKAPDVTLYERALSQVVAMKIAERSDVRGFRAKHLEGHVIPWDDISHWIRRQESPKGIPATSYATLSVPDEAMRRVRQAIMSRTIDETAEINIPVRLGDLIKCDPGPLSLSYLVPGEDAPRQTFVWSDTALHGLYWLVVRLVGVTTWTEAQTVVFVLTGQTPLIRQFTSEIAENADLPALTRVMLLVDPRISQREIAHHFQSVRQNLFHARHRDISAKHLTLALFSTTREGQEGSLADRMNRWNAQYPEWAYKHVTNFSRDISVALRRLLGSGYEAALAPTADEEIEK